MSSSRLLIIVLVLSLTVSVSAQTQQPNSSVEQRDPVEKAHESLLNTATDRATEAGRLTEALVGALPQGTLAGGPMSRRTYIDEHIFGRMERDGIPHAPLSSDTEFVRRVYLDTTGSLPEPEQVREFVASKDPKKRDKLIDSLVGTENFAEQWAWHWMDITQVMDGDFFYWFKRGLMLDRPYNDLSHEILSAGTLKSPGSNPAWAVTSEPAHSSARTSAATDQDNQLQYNRLDFLDNMTVALARTFLGINLDCISCHNGARHLEPLNLYLSTKTRREFAQQSAFWARMNMGVMNDDNPGYATKNDAPYFTSSENRFPRDGRTHEPAFILTGETPRPGIEPRKELARMVTNHIQFSRATVNVVWGKLMTVGFVEPYDGFDLLRLDPNNPPPKPWTVQPTNPWLLDAMANDFQKNNYSLLYLIKTIMKSNAYQLTTQFPGEWKDAYAPYYARRFARVLTGSEAADAVAQVTGVPYDFKWVGQDVRRIKQLFNPRSVNPPESLALGGSGNDLGGEGTVEGNSIRAIMQSFFQSFRETPALIGNRPSAVQAMVMMTAPSLMSRVSATTPNSRLRRLFEAGKSDDEIVGDLFLAALSRAPKPEEIEVARRILKDGDRRERAEDVEWALLNSIEFLLNH
jgi:hypothetical protein